MRKVSVILIEGLILFTLFFFLNKLIKKHKKNEMFNLIDAQNAINYIAKYKSPERARIIEQMMRLETGNFTSQQYQNTGSAGMEDGNWYHLPPHDVKTFKDPVKGDRPFIVWHSVTDFAKYLCDYIDRQGGNWARWNSTDPLAQIEYTKRVLGITPHFI